MINCCQKYLYHQFNGTSILQFNGWGGGGGGSFPVGKFRGVGAQFSRGQFSGEGEQFSCCLMYPGSFLSSYLFLFCYGRDFLKTISREN